jgi:hypothetical protein
VRRRDRLAGRACRCGRHGAAQATGEARPLARPARWRRSPSAGRSRTRSPTSNYSVSLCTREASTPKRSPRIDRGSLREVEPENRSDRTGPLDASVAPTVVPARTIADGLTRVLYAPRRDGRLVRKRRSRSAQARTRACRRPGPTAALDRRSSRPLPCRVAARRPLDERNCCQRVPTSLPPATRHPTFRYDSAVHPTHTGCDLHSVNCGGVRLSDCLLRIPQGGRQTIVASQLAH